MCYLRATWPSSVLAAPGEHTCHHHPSSRSLLRQRERALLQPSDICSGTDTNPRAGLSMCEMSNCARKDSNVDTPHPKYLCSSSLFIHIYSSASVGPSEKQIVQSQGDTCSYDSLKPLFSCSPFPHNTTLEMGLIMIYPGRLYISTVFLTIPFLRGLFPLRCNVNSRRRMMRVCFSCLDFQGPLLEK